MRYELDICNLTAGELDSTTNAVTVRATVDLTDEPGDVEHFGNVGMFGQLGVSALPAPATDDGKSRAEGVVIRNIAGSNGAVIGARDTRSASVYANLQSGDTCLHATDENASAQFQAKANRQAITITKDSGGDTMIINLDGKNDKIQIAAFGFIFEVDKAADRLFMCTPSGGASIMMQKDTISLIGKIILGGKTPILPLIQTVAGAGVTFTPANGVFLGA